MLPAMFDYDFTASSNDSDSPIPSWAWALMSILLFASHTLDGIGKQLRKYKNLDQALLSLIWRSLTFTSSMPSNFAL